MILDLEAAIRAASVAALRKRAARQRAIAEAGEVKNEAGAIVRAGEAAVASRLAVALAAVADEIEADG